MLGQISRTLCQILVPLNENRAVKLELEKSSYLCRIRANRDIDCFGDWKLTTKNIDN